MRVDNFLQKLKSGFVFCFLTGLIIIGACGSSAYAAYPDRPIRLVVGFAPGGANDIIGRLIAKELTTDLGVSVVVENKPGASSNIGTAFVAHSAADGYTLFLASLNNAINQSLYHNLPFNFVSDFSPVALIATMPNILVVNSASPYHSVKELVAYGKAHPGRLTFASSGTGTSLHLAGELFKIQAGIKIVHIPYKGSALAMTDLLGGRVDLMFDNLISSISNIKSGKLRALAIASPQRSPSLPDIPTMAESGYPKFDVSSWFGVLAPRNTPPDIIQKINASVGKALKNPEMTKKLEQLGATPQAMTPQAFGDFIKSQVDKWGTVIRAAGVTAAS
ncbi:tripartite tricarboxylate transporter substrate binding protein [Paralcaligenes ureilyticus]|uniref:Tripartite-type tricarboxylate transporter receptor subunit TctC n=1 Tax=Paralcaligenes ureilyticus TaxID=627131 RepID=A0A4R3MAQ6_9BURK|nr:tripartite tricarboxylate transporter substrate binding protein [Paralcaligenes ureilyticus]TCT08937.1 tripartite-type tricarboxylate transporter receptor subunit TctC [Paralcaligenes ureilyticus]